jgi:hypothetical protein
VYTLLELVENLLGFTAKIVQHPVPDMREMLSTHADVGTGAGEKKIDLREVREISAELFEKQSPDVPKEKWHPSEILKYFSILVIGSLLIYFFYYDLINNEALSVASNASFTAKTSGTVYLMGLTELKDFLATNAREVVVAAVEGFQPFTVEDLFRIVDVVNQMESIPQSFGNWMAELETLIHLRSTMNIDMWLQSEHNIRLHELLSKIRETLILRNALLS